MTHFRNFIIWKYLPSCFSGLPWRKCWEEMKKVENIVVWTSLYKQNACIISTDYICMERWVFITCKPHERNDDSQSPKNLLVLQLWKTFLYIHVFLEGIFDKQHPRQIINTHRLINTHCFKLIYNWWVFCGSKSFKLKWIRINFKIRHFSYKINWLIRHCFNVLYCNFFDYFPFSINFLVLNLSIRQNFFQLRRFWTCWERQI